MAAYLLRARSATTAFQRVKGHNGTEGNVKADHKARECANKLVADLLDISMSSSFDLQGAKLATISQSTAYAGILRFDTLLQEGIGQAQATRDPTITTFGRDHFADGCRDKSRTNSRSTQTLVDPSTVTTTSIALRIHLLPSDLDRPRRLWKDIYGAPNSYVDLNLEEVLRARIATFFFHDVRSSCNMSSTPLSKDWSRRSAENGEDQGKVSNSRSNVPKTN
ncbi:hypothetical protein DENSPDRAFT_849983 [Dentipellis sp. KUC8613]|nr:hypothetical protein DENSPDRAFT_849983 [Dentipellis sp. KUC8613]